MKSGGEQSSLQGEEDDNSPTGHRGSFKGRGGRVQHHREEGKATVEMTVLWRTGGSGS